jgi:RNA polymerase sigma factor (sigma-70 family)
VSASLSSSSSSTAGKSALDLAVEADADKGDLRRFLFFVAYKRGLRDHDAEDIVEDAFRVGFQHERAGGAEKWDPSKEAATLYLGNLAVNLIRNHYRRARRKPTSEIGENEDFASAAPTAEEIIGEAQEREVQAAEVRSRLAKETKTGLSLRIIDKMREGVRGHAKIAEELGCTLEEVRAAIKRITRRARLMAGGKKP